MTSRVSYLNKSHNGSTTLLKIGLFWSHNSWEEAARWTKTYLHPTDNGKLTERLSKEYL